MASLFVVRGRDQGKHFPLQPKSQRIGRDRGSDIQLLDSEASRSHAEIRPQPGGNEYCLVDLDSSNGTRVNGATVAEHLLATGDRIEIGRTLLIFTGSGPLASAESVHGVDIIQPAHDSDASQIVSSLSQSSGTSEASGSEAERSLEVIYLTAIAVGRGEDLDTVLNRILRLVFDWVDADRGCIMLREPESGELQPAARCDRESAGTPIESFGSATGDPPPQRISISHTILDYVLNKKEGVRTSDAKDDARFEAAASIVRAGVREALCVPLQGRYGIVGALYVDTYTSAGQLMQSGGRERFTDDHLRLITAIGHQAALAIEDTFYYSALVQNERLAAMGQTIATLSHHIKNILQGIRGGSYLIDAGLNRDDQEAVRKGWSIVEKNQDRISKLVLDMLSFSKEREPEKVEGDLNACVAEVVELMRSRADELQVELGCHLERKLPVAEFDPEGLHRAILNLVTNAIDAAARASDPSPQHGEPLTTDLEWDDEESHDQSFAHSESGDTEGGKVFVRTLFDPAEGWCIDVIDNGPGVPRDQREKIFSPFESTKGASGTGLGLPVSEKIVREHGGTIQVIDSGIGSGSCFRIRLPRQATHVSEVSRRETRG